MRTVYDVSDRVLMLNNGTIIFDGNTENINNVDDPVVRQFINGDSTLA